MESDEWEQSGTMELKLNLLAKTSREPGGKVYKQGCLNDTLCSTHHMLKVSDENGSKYSKYNEGKQIKNSNTYCTYCTL